MFRCRIKDGHKAWSFRTWKERMMKMLNKAVLDDLREAGMDSPQAEVVAAHIPDWSQLATKQEVKTLRWMVLGGFATVLLLPDNWIVLALEWLAKFF